MFSFLLFLVVCTVFLLCSVCSRSCCCRHGEIKFIYFCYMTFAFSALTRVALEKYCYVVFDIFTVVRVYAMLWVYCL